MSDIKTISRPGKPDLEFRLCRLSMVAIGDTIIMPGRLLPSGDEMFGKVGDTETQGTIMFTHTRLLVRAQTETGFEIVPVEDDSSRMQVWVLVP